MGAEQSVVRNRETRGESEGEGWGGGERRRCFKEMSFLIEQMRQGSTREGGGDDRRVAAVWVGPEKMCEESINAYRVCFSPAWLMRLFGGCNVHRVGYRTNWSIECHPGRKNITCTIKPPCGLLNDPRSHTPRQKHQHHTANQIMQAVCFLFGCLPKGYLIYLVVSLLIMASGKVRWSCSWVPLQQRIYKKGQTQWLQARWMERWN